MNNNPKNKATAEKGLRETQSQEQTHRRGIDIVRRSRGGGTPGSVWTGNGRRGPGVVRQEERSGRVRWYGGTSRAASEGVVHRQERGEGPVGGVIRGVSSGPEVVSGVKVSGGGSGRGDVPGSGTVPRGPAGAVAMAGMMQGGLPGGGVRGLAGRAGAVPAEGPAAGGAAGPAARAVAGGAAGGVAGGGSGGAGTRDPEEERMERIRRNYETDKAALAGEREPQPALARSASHDAGGAGGSGGGAGGSGAQRIRKSVDDVVSALQDDIRQEG